MNAVTCTSTSFCIAVDADGAVITSTNPLGGGPVWRLVTLGFGVALNAISCPAANLCVVVDAIGGVRTSTNPGGGTMAWSAPVRVDGYAINAISCPSTTLCVGVDNVGNAVSSTKPTTGSWKVRRINPLNNPLDGVSCPSAHLCVAVDAVGHVLTSTNPGGTAAWKVTPVDGPNALTGVSCPTINLCVAVDNFGSVLTATNPTGGSGAWTKTKVDSVYSMTAVSCSATPTILCVAIDSYPGNVVTSTDPIHHRWATPVRIDNGQDLRGVGCPSAKLCVAVDQAGNVVGSAHPTGAWSLANRVDGTNAITGISCNVSPSTLCVAVDAAGNVETTGGPVLVDSGHVLSGISCPTTTLCVAVDTAGFVVWSNHPTAGAGAWHRFDINGTNPLSAISCTVTPTMLCLATDTNTGLIYHSTNPTAGSSFWSAAVVTFTTLTGVSCPTASLCVVVGANGSAYASKNPTGTVWSSTDLEGGSGPTLDGVSCTVTPTTLCIAVDSASDVFHSSNPTGGTAWSGVLAGLSNLALYDVSCPTTSLCVAVDSGGDAVMSTTPAGPRTSWTISELTTPSCIERCGPNGSGPALLSVSCPTSKLCYTADVTGHVIMGTGT